MRYIDESTRALREAPRAYKTKPQGQAPNTGSYLSQDELHAMRGARLETTVSMSSHSVRTLLDYPEQRALPRSNQKTHSPINTTPYIHKNQGISHV